MGALWRLGRGRPFGFLFVSEVEVIVLFIYLLSAIDVN